MEGYTFTIKKNQIAGKSIVHQWNTLHYKLAFQSFFVLVDQGITASYK